MINQEKRRIFQENLRIKEKERELQQERKKVAESLKNNPQENMLFIQKQFRIMSTQMERLILLFKNKQSTLVDLNAHFTIMKSYYVDINYVLTTYDRQYYKEMLQKISVTLLELKNKHEPKKKFKFSRRDEDFGVKETQNIQIFKQSKEKMINIAGIQNKKKEKLLIKNECAKNGSFKIVDCQEVQIDILQKTEILFLKNLKKCTIRAALTKSTVFVDKCQQCIFQLNCHQLRIHNTSNSKFSIFVTSKAIIQDCNNVIFSPYKFVYDDRQLHEKQQERTDKINLWRDIQDFNWLKENQKSPHYSLSQE